MSIESISQNNYVLTTQQAVTHDESMSGNGTVESPLSVVPGYNETVLWSGTASTAMSLSESISSFDRLRVYCTKYNTDFICDGVINSNTSFSFAGQNFSDKASETQRFWLCGGSYTGSNLNFASHYGQLIYFKYNNAQFTFETMNVPITKIVGINRKA